MSTGSASTWMPSNTNLCSHPTSEKIDCRRTCNFTVCRVATMSTGSAVTWMTYDSVKRWLAQHPGGGLDIEVHSKVAAPALGRHAAATPPE